MTRQLAQDDAGLTLVELIVTIVVSGIVLALIAITFVNGMVAQRDGVIRDNATGAANVVSRSLTTSVRNATEIRVNDAGTRLDAVFIAPDGTPECRAWEVRDGRLVYRSDQTTPLPAADDTWGTLASGIEGTIDGTAVFGWDDSKNLRIGMTITMEGITAPLESGVTAQAVGGGGLTCWD
ncbi:prepilin-type N-terminal cleavage/methylation domain-containing protein [uncultured Microbacterium sp.]|uniref:pilus assembly FimT family protein n=1 Tax=uncultured Microbacterium sp. TaxID=191216 RepID=UPI002628EAAE|nr:prepilin-type N-terminal cleavage/methylation domain-containing protein [uncultured Microbacterium sp.]